MSRKKSERPRKIQKWEKGNIDNIGVVTAYPYDIIFNHITGKNILNIVNLFFSNTTQKIDLLDRCILEQFWWTIPEIGSGKYSEIEHPTHYSGEYIFDKNNGERTIIEIRQPDIDGKHWKADHIHIKRGTADLQSEFKINNPTFNEHIELISKRIKGVYIMKIE